MAASSSSKAKRNLSVLEYGFINHQEIPKVLGTARKDDFEAEPDVEDLCAYVVSGLIQGTIDTVLMMWSWYVVVSLASRG